MSLVEEIARAFKGVTEPESVTHCGPGCLECSELETFFHGRDPFGITPDQLSPFQDSFILLTKEAQQRYVATFMMAELLDPGEAGVAAEYLADFFRTSGLVEDACSAWTVQQLTAVQGFMRECARRYNDGVYDPDFREAAQTIRDYVARR